MSDDDAGPDGGSDAEEGSGGRATAAETSGTSASAEDAERDQRLDELEAAEADRLRRSRLDHRFELLEAVILSIAALLAAWTGYQSARWSGVQANNYSLASASRVESSKASTTAGQETTVDVITFTQWLQAAEQEGLFTKPPTPGEAYTPDPNTVSGFLYQRFRPEFKTAVDAWIATQPRVNPDAPPTPFAMPEYKVAASQDAQRLDQQAEAHSEAARAANERADNYVLMTIMFATVLFFAGISSKMDTFRARAFLLGLASTILVVTFAIVASFPKRF